MIANSALREYRTEIVRESDYVCCLPYVPLESNHFLQQSNLWITSSLNRLAVWLAHHRLHKEDHFLEKISARK